MLTVSLPLSLEADWRNEPPQPIAENLSQWLFESGSLTQKLKQHCSEFRVEILSKQLRRLSPAQLPLFAHHALTVQVREVLLYCDGLPWVFAQTLMPMSDIPQSVMKLVELGEKPLGDLIFNDPGVVRSSIEVAQFDGDSIVAQVAAEVGKPAEHPLWARRSMFVLDDYSLLVAEVFLPQAGCYQ